MTGDTAEKPVIHIEKETKTLEIPRQLAEIQKVAGGQKNPTSPLTGNRVEQSTHGEIFNRIVELNSWRTRETSENRVNQSKLLLFQQAKEGKKK